MILVDRSTIVFLAVGEHPLLISARQGVSRLVEAYAEQTPSRRIIQC